jgi:nicotinamide mononucleotide transporter
VVSVFLSVRQNIWSWPTAIINVSLYFVVFHRARLYADMGLQVFYAAISIYGWYHWLFGGANRTRLKVSLTPRFWWPLLALLWLAASYALGTILSRHTDAAVPYVDSALTVGSLVAQWMMTRKYVENWLIWVLLDVAYVIVFIDRGLILTAVLYAIYLVLASLGFIEWRRAWRNEQLGAAPTAIRPA